LFVSFSFGREVEVRFGRFWGRSGFCGKPASDERAFGLQIAEPPTLLPLFERGEPCAWQVKKGYCKKPRGVDHWQAEAVAVWGLVHPERAVKEPRCRLLEDICERDGGEMNDIEMQDVKEQRHTAEDEERVEKALAQAGGGQAIKDGQQD